MAAARELATEFVQTCDLLGHRANQAFRSELNYQDFGRAVFRGDPVARLHELLGQVVGTGSFQKYLQEKDFVRHGYCQGDIVSDTPYEQWPDELDIDLNAANYGPFDPDKVKEIEMRYLWWSFMPEDFKNAWIMEFRLKYGEVYSRENAEALIRERAKRRLELELAL